MSGLERSERLSKWASSMLEDLTDDTVGRWPQAAAMLTRRALEEAVDHLWAGRSPGMSECSHRAQLLCLPRYIDSEIAHRATYAYASLSRACHYSAYELPPTQAELHGWLDTVEELRGAVDASTDSLSPDT